MRSVVFRLTYSLGEAFQAVRERANEVVGQYLQYPDLITFDLAERTVSFRSERIIPARTTGRPRVMLLFSNPHPHSVHQGMFLSPNRQGGENLFWPTMEDAGWLRLPARRPSPEHLAEICLEATYEGPFEFSFYCYYAFPTDYPEDIERIFGKEHFAGVIEPEARDEFLKTVEEIAPAAVVTFNKGIFSEVSEATVERYIERLCSGELIGSRIRGVQNEVPIYLTFPTGWRYRKEYRRLRKESLEAIGTAILQRTV